MGETDLSTGVLQLYSSRLCAMRSFFLLFLASRANYSLLAIGFSTFALKRPAASETVKFSSLTLVPSMTVPSGRVMDLETFVHVLSICPLWTLCV